MNRAVYNSENGKWYRHCDDPWSVRLVTKKAIGEVTVTVVADTYADAFEQLFGQPVVFPPIVRGARHVVLA